MAHPPFAYTSHILIETFVWSVKMWRKTWQCTHLSYLTLFTFNIHRSVTIKSTPFSCRTLPLPLNSERFLTDIDVEITDTYPIWIPGTIFLCGQCRICKWRTDRFIVVLFCEWRRHFMLILHMSTWQNYANKWSCQDYAIIIPDPQEMNLYKPFKPYVLLKWICVCKYYKINTV